MTACLTEPPSHIISLIVNQGKEEYMSYRISRSDLSDKEKKEAGRLEPETPSQLPLGRNNFIWMCVSAALIVIGFLLMLGCSSTTEAFNPDIFSVRRIVVGPTIAFIGFIALGVSIIITPRGKSEGDE